MPPRFPWLDRLASGDAVLDRQHQALFACAERLAGLDPGRLNCLEALRILAELRRLTWANFSHEEQLLGTDPEAAEHRRQHARILAEMDEVLRSSQPVSRMLDLAHRFLIDWLPVHIARHDRKLVATTRTDAT